MLSNYGNNFCKIRLKGFDFLTIQLVTNAWGEMAAGDEIRMRLILVELKSSTTSLLNHFPQLARWTQLI